jgi:rare lipoprotein A
MGRNVVAAGWGVAVRFGAAACCCLLLAQCGGTVSSKLDPKYGVTSSPRLVNLGEPVPKGGGTYRVGKPYVVGGQIYTPEENPHYSEVGLASWYGDDFHGRQTANGEIFDMTALSAAHPTLPIPSYVRVTNLANNRSVIVRVNDRGPYHANRLIDVSVRTAKMLGFYDEGVTRVRVDYVGRAALTGSDDVKLAATLRQGSPAPSPSEVRVASSRPFLPQSSEPMRGEVPLPTDRPYELGHDGAGTNVAKRVQPSTVAVVTRKPIAPVVASSKVAAAEPPKTTASAAAKPAASVDPGPNFASRFAPAGELIFAPPSQAAAPVSAFAAPAPANGALLNGRGLY